MLIFIEASTIKLIAILSDFGQSEFLGIMKGIILQINPKTEIIDLCNTIASGSIREGAWILYNSFQFFPKGTIFLCVVDPGVGTKREPISIFTTNYSFVGPNNGLLFPAASHDRIKTVRELEVPNEASSTFHGRDVFAPAAAWIASEKITAFKEFKGILKELKFQHAQNEGEIIRIDHFGNAITTIKEFTPAFAFEIQIGSQRYTLDLNKTYEQGGDVPFLIVGSSGTLEISIKGKSAAQYLNLRVGQKITLNPLSD
ncbi:MAG: S-adenosyl-l-methionine hydroxide adenosyltransferase family protein [Promethearchaeota archaeon]